MADKAIVTIAHRVLEQAQRGEFEELIGKAYRKVEAKDRIEGEGEGDLRDLRGLIRTFSRNGRNGRNGADAISSVLRFSLILLRNVK